MIDVQDKSTVISLFPLPIMEEKPGLYPGRFAIAAADNDNPALLVVGQSVHYVDVGEDRPQLHVVHPSVDIARSIVEDFIAAQLATNEGAKPGLAWVRGESNLAEVKGKHAKLLAAMRASHRQWYIELVKLADDDWQKYHKHSVIHDVQRIAARTLKLERDWLLMVAPEDIPVCPACGSTLSTGVVVCPHCRCIVDKVKYKELTFAQ